MAKSNLPYGDAFIVGTPALDRLTANVYAEDRLRQQQRVQQSRLLEDEFRKNIANVKDVDIPKITGAWQNYKAISQDLLKSNPNTDQSAFIQKQLDKQKALANVYSLINGSKQSKTEEEELYKNISKNPNAYSDNAYDLLTARRKTPLENLQNYQGVGGDGKPITYDLTNPNTYTYKGTNTDFSKIDKSAQGIAKANWLPEEPVDKSGIQFKQKSFMFGNTPQQYYQDVLGSLSQHQANRDASAIISQTDPQTLKAIQDEYNAIPVEKWQKIGLNAPQNLDILPTDPLPIQYAKHAAQLYFLNNEPKEGETKFRTNEDLKMQKQSDLTLRNEKTMAGINHGFQAWLHTQPTWKEAKEGSEDAQNANAVISTIGSLVPKPTKDVLFGNDKYLPVTVNDPSILARFKGISRISSDAPSDISYNPNKKQFELTFHAHDKNNVEHTDIVPLSPKVYLSEKIKQLYPNKDIGNINNMVTKYYDATGGDIYKMIDASQGKPTQQTQPKTETIPSTLNASHWKKNNKK